MLSCSLWDSLAPNVQRFPSAVCEQGEKLLEWKEQPTALCCPQPQCETAAASVSWQNAALVVSSILPCHGGLPAQDGVFTLQQAPRARLQAGSLPKAAEVLSACHPAHSV